MSEYRLEMCDVVKTFPGVKALNHAQLKLKPGTVHALMGENGAGKSTLMKCMFGIYHMDEGKVIYEGQEVQIKGPLDALNRGIAMVHQELQPHPAGFCDDGLSTVAERERSAQDPIPRFAPFLRQPVAERGRTDETDSRVAGAQRYFHYGEYLRASGFAVQEPERPDDGKHTDTARSAAHKEVVI